MLPKWLQPIENAFRTAEGKIDNKRFFMIAGVFVLAGVILSLVILNRRHEAGWLQDTKAFDASGKDRKYCGKDIRWDKAELPVKVYLDTALDASWEPSIADALKLADPWGKLFNFMGRLGPAVMDAPQGAITIGPTNDDQHGHERWEVVDAGTYCKMTRSQIELPVLILPGKARTRAAAHELLHSMGLSHSDWETHLMYPVATTLFPFSMAPKEKELLEGAYIR